MRLADDGGRFQDRLAVGGTEYVLRLDQLLTQFVEGLSAGEIAGLLRAGDDTYPLRDLTIDQDERRYLTLRRGDKRLVGIPPQPDAAALFAYARALYARYPGRVVYAWPVYEAKGQPGSTAATPLLDTFVVRLDEGRDQAAMLGNLERLGLRRNTVLSELLAPFHYFTLDIAGDPLRGVALHEKIAGLGATADFDWLKLETYAGTGVLNDPYWTRQWNMRTIQASEAWGAGAALQAARVAVIDSGFDLTQEDLLPFAAPATWFNIDEALADLPGPYHPTPSGDPHGTAVAGIVGAKGANALGVAGVADRCEIVPIRLGLNPSAARAAACLRWAANPAREVRVVNLSFGAVPLPALAAVVQAALDANIVLCAAAGNYWLGEDHGVDYPASDPGVIAVGATMRDDWRKVAGEPGGSWSSKYGVELDVVAPGVDVPTTDESGGQGYNPDSSGLTLDGLNVNYVLGFGTSVAAPQVAGLAALILSRFPHLNREQVKRVIATSCDHPAGYVLRTADAAHPAAWHEEIGCGRINCRVALEQAAALPHETWDPPVKEDHVPLTDAELDHKLTLLQDKGTQCPGLRALRGVHYVAGAGDKAGPSVLFLTLDMDEWVEFDSTLVRDTLRNTDQTAENPLGFWIVWVASDATLQHNRVRAYHDRQEMTADFLRGELAARLRPLVGATSPDGEIDPRVLQAAMQLGRPLGYSTVRGPCQ